MTDQAQPEAIEDNDLDTAKGGFWGAIASVKGTGKPNVEKPEVKGMERVFDDE